MKGTAVTGVIVAALAAGAVVYGVTRVGGVGSEAGVVTPAHASAKVPVATADAVWGKESAPVTIVEFSDFECPYCSKGADTIQQLKETYGPEKVRIVFKNLPLPFHKSAGPAALAGATVLELAGDEAFWKFHDKAFKNQKSLTEENFVLWATEAGVDKAKFQTAYAAKSAQPKVDADMKLAETIGARGTPHFFINGVRLSGALPLEEFKKKVDEQTAAAQKLQTEGVPAADVYVKLTEQNFQAPAPEAPRKPPPSPAEDKTIYKAEVLKTDPVKGSPKALVTIVEFSDYQCPFCSRVEPTVKQIVDTYGEQVRVVWKDNALPFHNMAKPAAALGRYAYETGGDKTFWKVQETLFANQAELQHGDEGLKKIAELAGVDWAQAKKAIDSGKYNAAIDASMALAQKLGATGTPAFFVNGRKVTGARPFEQFKEVIDQEIIRAKGLGGANATEIYTKAIAQGIEAPAPAAGGAQGAAFEPTKATNVPAVPADAPFKGGKNAKIVIQEFSDFQCPFCSRVNPTMEQIKKEYGDQVKIVWRNLPLDFHANAPLAAEAAYEVYKQKGDEAFWKFHDVVFANQKAIERTDLEAYASQVGGIDMAKFKAALDQRTHKARVEQDKQAGSSAGINGTPGFLVGSYVVSGARPFEHFKTAIEKAKADAGGAAPAPGLKPPPKKAPPAKPVPAP